jgi:hypothetical protein
MAVKLPKPRIPHLAKRADQILALGAAWHDDYLHDDHSLSKWFGVSDQWPTQTRIKGGGPPFSEALGPRHIRYPHKDAMAWLRSFPLLTRTSESPHRGKVWNSPHRQGNGAAPPEANRNVALAAPARPANDAAPRPNRFKRMAP